MVTRQELRERLQGAVAAHDTLMHPYYRAWTEGALTVADLRAYAAQYRHQVEALPSLLRGALAQAQDEQARASLQRNLSEEEGAEGRGEAHLELWLRFVEALGCSRAEALDSPAHAMTRESGAELRAAVAQGEVEALAALWAYEAQTARVAGEKRAGLSQRYGLRDARALSFFSLHEELDLHHRDELEAALHAACARHGQGAVERACAAAERSARAQWRFLDGAEAARAARC
jgi:pyrroloquinoline-quinone synthase